MLVGVQHSLPFKGIDLILGNSLVGEKVAGVLYMLNSPKEVQGNIVYPACAVTRAMAKRTEGESRSLEKVAIPKKDGEE